MSVMKERRHRILIAEDDPDVADDYVRALDADCAYLGMQRTGLAELEESLFGVGPSKSGRAYFDVTLCEQGDAAVRAHAKALAMGSRFDLALIDMRMPPGMNGVETAALLRAADPHIPIGIVTGYSDLRFREIAARISPAERLFFVRKPFVGYELRECVANKLGILPGRSCAKDAWAPEAVLAE